MSGGRSASTTTRRCRTSSWAVCASSASCSPRTWPAKSRTVDFWASLIAGIAVLGVVFFPTPCVQVSHPARQPAAALPSRPGAHSSSSPSVSIKRRRTACGVRDRVHPLLPGRDEFPLRDQRGTSRERAVWSRVNPSRACSGSLLDPHHVHAAHPGRRSLGFRGRRHLAIDPALHRGSRFRLGLRHLLAGGPLPP